MKKIAIPIWVQGPGSIGIGKTYAELILSLGATPVLMTNHMFPTRDAIIDFFEDIDMLMLPGGLDVNPDRYGAIPGYRTQNPNVQLEWFDTNVLPVVLGDTNVPVTGICRGMQSLSVLYGADIIQDSPQPYSEPRTKLVEKLKLSHNLPDFLRDVMVSQNKSLNLSKHNREINSLHHQAVDPGSVEGELMVVAVSNETGTTEVVATNDGRVIGFQYHPEEIYDEFAIALMLHQLYHEDDVVMAYDKSNQGVRNNATG